MEGGPMERNRGQVLAWAAERKLLLTEMGKAMWEAGLGGEQKFMGLLGVRCLLDIYMEVISGHTDWSDNSGV